MMENKYDLINNSDGFLEESIEILNDYIYSNRACYFIELSSLDEELLLFHIKNRKIDIEKEINYINSFKIDENMISFISRRILVAYHYADGIIIDPANEKSIMNHKEIYEQTKKESELISVRALDDLSKYEYVLLGRKVLWISTKDDVPSELENVELLKVDVNAVLSSENWLEEYDFLKLKVMVCNFDVAFVKIGLLSTPLCNFISQILHKIAISKGE